MARGAERRISSALRFASAAALRVRTHRSNSMRSIRCSSLVQGSTVAIVRERADYRFLRRATWPLF